MAPKKRTKGERKTLQAIINLGSKRLPLSDPKKSLVDAKLAQAEAAIEVAEQELLLDYEDGAAIPKVPMPPSPEFMPRPFGVGSVTRQEFNALLARVQALDYGEPSLITNLQNGLERLRNDVDDMGRYPEKTGYTYVGTASPAPGGTQGHFYANFGSVITWLRFLADASADTADRVTRLDAAVTDRTADLQDDIRQLRNAHESFAKIQMKQTVGFHNRLDKLESHIVGPDPGGVTHNIGLGIGERLDNLDATVRKIALVLADSTVPHWRKPGNLKAGVHYPYGTQGVDPRLVDPPTAVIDAATRSAGSSVVRELKNERYQPVPASQELHADIAGAKKALDNMGMPQFRNNVWTDEYEVITQAALDELLKDGKGYATFVGRPGLYLIDGVYYQLKSSDLRSADLRTSGFAQEGVKVRTVSLRYPYADTDDAEKVIAPADDKLSDATCPGTTDIFKCVCSHRRITPALVRAFSMQAIARNLKPGTQDYIEYVSAQLNTFLGGK